MNTPVSGAVGAGIPATGIPVAPARISTGYPALDARLGGGWPVGVLTDLLVSHHGSGELGLLSPALAALTAASDRWVLLIAPPWIPYAPGLSWQGIALDRVLVVRPRQPPEALWAMEEALRSGTCAGVIAWTGMKNLPRTGHTLLKRLHLLAGRQAAWAVLVRPARFRGERSPARLRLELLSATPATLQVEVFRNGCQRMGKGTGTVTVERHT